MKRYILELVGLSLAVAAMTSHAADYTYTNVAGTIKITGYIGSGGAVTIPSTINGLPVTIIGEAAFHHSDLTGVTSVTIPNSVVSIESSAFAGCDGLTKITLGNGVASIGDYAFGGCDAITSITIPSSISHIGSEVFSACFSLTTINVGANSYYCSVSGVLFNKSQTTLIQYPSDKPGAGYTIPGSVTCIGDGAFSDNMNLTSITIPSSVTTIGTEAFYNCEFLPSITLPSSVTYIGDGAFQRCYALKSVYFKGNAPSIGGSEVFVRDPGGWGDPEPCYVTVYYLQGASGWSSTFCGRPTALSSGVMLNRLNIIGGTGGGLYTNGAKVKISATTPVGMKFARWNDGNTNTPRVITMAAIPVTYTANFTDIAKPTVAFKTPTALQKVFGTNGSFTVTGTALDNLALSNVMVSVNGASAVPASPASTNGLKNWTLPVMLSTSLGGTNTIAAYSVDTTGNHSSTSTVKCVYTETGALNITTNGPGKVTVTPTGPLLLGKTYTLTAAANAGAVFSNWTGAATSTSNKIAVTLNATNKTVSVTANFTDTAKPTLTITLPTANLRITNTNPVYTVKGTATDNSSVASVKVRLNSGDWTNAVTTNAWKSWSVPVTLPGGTNTILAYSVDNANNCSATSSVKCIYLETVTLADYYPLPLGAQWLYNGTDDEGYSCKISNRVASVNLVITNFTGGAAARSYTTNCVSLFMAYLYPGDVYTWDEYMAGGRRYGYFGNNDLPDESIRVDGGLFPPAQMVVGASASGTGNWYDKGVFQGSGSWKLQILEKTPFTVPAGTFQDVLHVRITFGPQVYDQWWAKSVGLIKRQGISGPGAVEKYELIQYSIPSASSIAASSDPMGIPSSGQDVVPVPTPQAEITVDGSSKDWTGIPRSASSYSSVTQEVAVALDGNNIALLLKGCPFSTSDTVLVYFKLRLTYGTADDRHTVDLWTSGSVLYGMVDGQVITGLEAILLNGVLEVKIPVEQAPSQVTIEEVGCGMDVGDGMMTELFKVTSPPKSTL